MPKNVFKVEFRQKFRKTDWKEYTETLIARDALDAGNTLTRICSDEFYDGQPTTAISIDKIEKVCEITL